MSELFNVLNIEQDTSLAPAPQEETKPTEPVSDLFLQIIEQDWLIPTAYQLATEGTAEIDLDFVATPEMFDAAQERGVQPQNFHALADVQNQNEWDRTVADILEEQELAQKLSDHGWTGTASRVLLNVGDPALWITSLGTGTLGGFGIASRIGQATRSSRIASMAGISAVEGAALEGFVSANKETLTTSDAIQNILMVTAAGGALGGFGASLGRKLTDVENTQFVRQADEAGIPLTQQQRDTLKPARAEVVDNAKGPDADLAPTAMSHFRLPFTDIKIPIRFDMANAIKTSPSEIIKTRLSRLAQDVVADVRDGQVNKISATELGDRLYQTYHGSFGARLFVLEKEFANEAGTRFFGNERDLFGQLIEQAVRREGDDFIDGLDNLNNVQKKLVKEARDSYRQMMRRILQDLKDAGVKNADEIDFNDLYVPRRISISKLGQMVQKAGGEENFVDFVAQAYLSKPRGLKLDEATAKALARLYVQGIKRADAGTAANFGQVSKQNIDDVRKFFENEREMYGSTEYSEELFETINGLLSKKATKGSSLSRKLDIDETFEATVNGNLLRMEDLYDSNAYSGMDKYAREMSGRIAAARVLGITDEAEFDQILRQATDDAVLDPKNKARVNRDVKRAQVMIRSLLGKPLHDRSATADTFTQLLLDYNYMRVMNQVGFAQLAELGNIGSLGGWRAMVTNMPALRAVQRDMATGQIKDDAILRDVESLTGIGTDWVRYASMSERYTGTTGGEVIGSNLTEAQKKALEIGVKGKRITSVLSGMTPITMYSQRLAGKTFIGKLGTLANKPLKESDRMNFREVGWSDEVTDQIMGQLRKASFSNGKLTDLNMQDWPINLREEFANGIYRWTNRVIQTNDVGAMGYWMTTALGKVITQFRTFMLVSYAKQTLQAVHRRDFAHLSAFMTTSLIGGLAYMGQTYLRTGGEDPELFELDAIAKAAFQRSAYASLIPGLTDSTLEFIGLDPMFSKYGRSTGMATSLWSGNPTVSTADKLLGLGKIPFKIATHADTEGSDFMDWLPYQNALFINTIVDRLSE